MDIHNKYKVVYILNQIFSIIFRENIKKIGVSFTRHSDNITYNKFTSSCLQVQESPRQ